MAKRKTRAERLQTLRGLTQDELRTKERETVDQRLRLKFRYSSGQTDTLAQIRDLRKEVARIKTVLRQKEREAAKASRS